MYSQHGYLSYMCNICAVQLFSSNVALIICYQYHIKIEKRSEIKAHLDNTVIVMSVILVYNVVLGIIVI